MAATIPQQFQDLLTKKAFAHLGTIMPDGSPQVTPVWFDFDGNHVRVNSAKGRVKDKNMRRDGRVALAIMDPENPYRYLAVRGRVEEVAEGGPMPTSIRSPRNILGRIATRIARRARSVSSIGSGLSGCPPRSDPGAEAAPELTGSEL